MVTIEDIRQAKKRISGTAIETPLIPYHGSCNLRQLYFKPENLQPIGAFKIRGAYNKISSLSDEEKSRGIVAHSSGNHAQAVAYSARALGVKSTVVMPAVAPAIKIQNTKSFGAEIILVEDGAEVEMKTIMDELSKQHGYVAIPPYDDELVIAGQGTVGLEIFDQCKNVNTVLVPIGGGGLISGIAIGLKRLNPNIQIIGVEPELANDTQLSFASGKIQSIPKEQAKSTIADGMRVTQPGSLTFPIIQEFVDEIVTVNESQILEATVKMLKEIRLMVEPSGATTFAAWLDQKNEKQTEGKSVCVVSGGNIDLGLLEKLLAKAEH